MIKCAYCEVEARNKSGMSVHVRTVHPDLWKGNLKASFPEGYEPGTPEPRIMKAKKTKKGKEPAPTKCPFCGHESGRPQGLAVHLKGAHPDKWKGNMGDTLGIGPSRKWTKKERGKGKKYMDKWYDRKKEEVLDEPRAFINCCPGCGEELAAYYLAKGAMERRRAANQ